MRTSLPALIAAATLFTLSGCGSDASEPTAEEAELKLGPKVKSVSPDGTENYCALREDGQVRCWSRRRGPNWDEAGPWNVREGADFAALSPIEGMERCGIRKSGQLACIPRKGSHIAQDVSGERAVQSVYGDCAVRESGQLICLDNKDGVPDWQDEWAEVPGITNVKQVAGVPRGRLCVLLEDQHIRCNDKEHFDFKEIPFVDDAVEIAVSGASGVCALRKNGHVLCWGSSEILGIGAQPTEDDPLNEVARAEVRGLVAVHIAGTNGAFCAVLDTGRVACWGRNMIQPTAFPILYGPEFVQGLRNAESVMVGAGDLACAVTKDDKQALCWGFIAGNAIGTTSPQPEWNKAVTYSELPAPIGGL